MRSGAFTAFAALVVAFSDVSVASTAPINGAAYYVSPAGNDSNPGTLAQPFQTLRHAQAQMQVGGHPKAVYLRAGTYSTTALKLTEADSGETWSYYPGDGYNTAVLDGGASSSITGGNVILIDGASNLTIDGLKIQNFQQYAIGVHGGIGDGTAGFDGSVASTHADTISNNIITNGYTNANKNWAGGGIWASGDNIDLTIANNVIMNQYGSAVRVVKYAGEQNSINVDYTFNGLTIRNNVTLITDTRSGDNGTIYMEDFNSRSTGISVVNNFIRDYQQNPADEINGADLPVDVAIYLDSGTSNVAVSGNVIAAAANAALLDGSHGNTNAFFNGGGQNNRWVGNIIDMGTSANLVVMAYDDQMNSATNNVVSQNIIIGRWSGLQRSSYYGTGPATFFYSGNVIAAHMPTVTNNLYYNYGGGKLLTISNQSFGGDSAPVIGKDPLISGTNYQLAAGSPAYGEPLSFPRIARSWGPPGYVIPPPRLP